jgi:hydrogenase maturation protease
VQVAVIGIGRTMRGDDAAGPAAVRMWQRGIGAARQPHRLRVRIIEEPGTELLDALEGIDAALIVDAVQPGNTPGAIRELAIEDLRTEEFSRGGIHAWGVAETLALGQAVKQVPASLIVHVLGIEAEQSDFGMPLSANVLASLPAASAAIEAQVQAFLAA